MKVNNKACFLSTVVPKRRKIIRIVEPYLFILPVIIGFLLFRLGPVITSLGLSFTRWTSITPAHWVGIGNYQTFFTDPLAFKVIWNTFYYAILSILPYTIVSLMLALLINRKLKGIIFFRTAYFLPLICPMTAVALIWGWLFEPQFGTINYLLEKIFGISGPLWLHSTTWAMPALAILGLWKGVGIGMILFLAGLQNIPMELYEAAKIDGASSLKGFLHITIPLISPITFFIIIINTIGALKVFDQIYVLTQGGPRWSTLTLGYFVYENAFVNLRMGYASAVAYILFIIVATITLFNFVIGKRWVYYR